MSLLTEEIRKCAFSEVAGSDKVITPHVAVEFDSDFTGELDDMVTLRGWLYNPIRRLRFNKHAQCQILIAKNVAPYDVG